MIKRASEVMSGSMVHIGWEQPVHDAFQMMQTRRLRHLPVLDADHQVIGIISDRDVQRAMKSELRKRFKRRCRRSNPCSSTRTRRCAIT